MEVFGKARFYVDQLAGVAGNAEGVGRSVVSLGETLFDVTNAEYLAVIQVAILIGNFDGVHGLLDLLEIIPCRNAAAYAVLLPFMLDQSAAGVILEHVPDSGFGNRLGGLAPDRRISRVRLGPKTMQYEVRLLAGAALIRMIVGMAGAIVRRP